MATLLGTPIHPNAIHYNSPALNHTSLNIMVITSLTLSENCGHFKDHIFCVLKLDGSEPLDYFIFFRWHIYFRTFRYMNNLLPIILFAGDGSSLPFQCFFPFNPPHSLCRQTVTAFQNNFHLQWILMSLHTSTSNIVPSLKSSERRFKQRYYTNSVYCNVDGLDVLCVILVCICVRESVASLWDYNLRTACRCKRILLGQ